MCLLPILILLSATLNDGFILRLSCKTFADFSVNRKDTSLEEVFATFYGISADECKGRCILDAKCKSVNSKEDDLICNLNDKSAEDKKDNVTAIEKPGWTYYSTSYNDTLIGHNCRSYKPCPAWKRCMDTCICPGYNCSDIDNCAGNRCKNGGSCQSKDRGFACTCTEDYDGPTCEEVKQPWFDNCATILLNGYLPGSIDKNSCYAACKSKNAMAASFKEESTFCYCSFSPGSTIDSDYQCTFIPPGLKEWESDCSYKSTSKPNSPPDIHQKWQCYYVCKSFKTYNGAIWLHSADKKCKCFTGEKMFTNGTNCIEIESN